MNILYKQYPTYVKLKRRLPWRLQKLIPEPASDQYYVLSDAPLIVIIPEDVHENYAKWEIFFRILRPKKAIFLCRVRYTLEPDTQVPPIAAWHNAYIEQNPQHRFIYLANTENEEKKLKQFGLECRFVNQNCFVDENMFQPAPNSEKLYDAIYNARLSRFKNIQLAGELENLALITYFAVQEDYDQFTESQQMIPNATALNWPEHPPLKDCVIGNYRKISINDISSYLNKARVGLCLSNIEGAMYASAEYLLCGLPVVSTESLGGRDVMFDDDYVIMVENSASAVKEAVSAMISRNLSPEFVRNRTLEKMEQHRRYFIDLIQRLYEESRINRQFSDEWNKLFVNRMYKVQDLKLISQYL